MKKCSMLLMACVLMFGVLVVPVDAGNDDCDAYVCYSVVSPFDHGRSLPD
ncbi:MAG: hypothetical protein FWB80_13030 [Defluviitaleaceae bacterium]|nr:hypothetical protein [Defluviitaleaceae bacterium]